MYRDAKPRPAGVPSAIPPSASSFSHALGSVQQKSASGALDLEVIEILDRDKTAGLDYDVRFDEAGSPFISGATRSGGIPRLPTFGVRFRF